MQLWKVIVFQENIGEWFYRIPRELFKFDLFWNEKMLHVMASQMFSVAGPPEWSRDHLGTRDIMKTY